MKMMIYLGLTVGSIGGDWVGSMADHGSMFGPWAIIGSIVGSIGGIWIGYKLGKEYFGL